MTKVVKPFNKDIENKDEVKAGCHCICGTAAMAEQRGYGIGMNGPICQCGHGIQNKSDNAGLIPKK